MEFSPHTCVFEAGKEFQAAMAHCNPREAHVHDPTGGYMMAHRELFDEIVQKIDEETKDLPGHPLHGIGAEWQRTVIEGIPSHVRRVQEELKDQRFVDKQELDAAADTWKKFHEPLYRHIKHKIAKTKSLRDQFIAGIVDRVVSTNYESV